MAKENPEKIESILVPHGAIESMAKDLDLSRSHVANAIKGRSSSFSASLIRRIAIKFYGGRL